MDHARDENDNSTLKRRRAFEDEGRPYYPHKTSDSTRPTRIGSEHVPVKPSPTAPVTTFVSPRTPGHLRINYLAQQYDGNLPLISSEDTIPSILNILNKYSVVIERHESLAGNMGARPLGPILIKRFERLFDGPPTVISSSEVREPVSWLDVLEFAQSRPNQFTLTQLSDGSKVCQFNTKQCRVQISEEDFLLVNSGLPRKLIPAQPIAEDEEKELGTLEIVERNISQITQLADQVAVRARQFNHRLRGRKQAILERRAAETVVSGAGSLHSPSPCNVALINGISAPELSASVPAIGVRPDVEFTSGEVSGISQSMYNELMKSFLAVSQKRTGVDFDTPAIISQDDHMHDEPGQSMSTETRTYHASALPSPKDVHIPPHITHRSHTVDEGGPFKAEMVARLESLNKGGRIVPPCDRCRRLHIDCLKNLTACMGCTKKHAKCSWREVKDYELRERHQNHSVAQDQQSIPRKHQYRDDFHQKQCVKNLGSE